MKQKKRLKNKIKILFYFFVLVLDQKKEEENNAKEYKHKLFLDLLGKADFSKKA